MLKGTSATVSRLWWSLPVYCEVGSNLLAIRVAYDFDFSESISNAEK